MTDTGFSLSGVAGGAVATISTSANLADRSHQGWMRELERAQAGLLGQADTKFAAPPREQQHDSGQAEVERRVAAPMQSLPAEVSAAWIPQLSVPAESEVGEAGVAATQVEASAGHFHPGNGEALVSMPASRAQSFRQDADVVPVTEYVLPGREEREFSSSNFRFVKAGEGVIDAAVRDKTMTMESELRLAQQIRIAVQSSGARLGRIWLNGQTITNNSQGEEHGN